MYYPFADLYQKFDGVCICIGYGRSAQQLIDDQSWIEYMSISCNYAQLSIPSPLWCGQDLDWFTLSRKQEQLQQNYGLIVNQKIQPHLREGTRGWIVHRASTDRLEIKKHSIRVPQPPTTGPLSMILAHAMGFDRIIIVGMDATADSYEYLRPHPRYGDRNPKKQLLQQQFIKKYTQKFNLINCSDNGLPRVDLQSALRGLKKNRSSSVDLLKKIHGERRHECITPAVPATDRSGLSR